MATMTISNHFAKWFSNKTSWTKMTWWKTSFNMPVKNIFDDGSIYTETEWMLNAIWEDTSFNLSWFDNWWEVIRANTVFTLYWPFTWWTINISQKWKNTYWTTIFTNWPVVWDVPEISDWYWLSYQLASNQWVTSWEINMDWTYNLIAVASWRFAQSNIFPVTFNNVPIIETHTPWMIWIENNQFCWISANWHIHKVNWTLISSPWATAWAIWVEWNYLYWIWTSWWKYRWPYVFKQFASFFSNWPSPRTISWQTNGMVWMDTNFWYEHIAYIDQNWDKWIFNSGENPYA